MVIRVVRLTRDKIRPVRDPIPDNTGVGHGWAVLVARIRLADRRTKRANISCLITFKVKFVGGDKLFMCLTKCIGFVLDDWRTYQSPLALLNE